MSVNSSIVVVATSGRLICSCDDPNDAAKICELLEADEQKKEKKQ